MKNTFIYFLIPLLLLTIYANVQAKNIYGDVVVTDLSTNKEHFWTRQNTKPPKYPVVMAMSNLKGCAVLAFDLNEKGRVDNIKLLQARPVRKLGSEARIALRKWRWRAPTKDSKGVHESRIFRFDYCIGGSSAEESKLLCKQQVKRECK